jgi:hypothetical protein
MNKQQILNHFHNGDVVGCIKSGIKSVFNSELLSMRNDDWVVNYGSYYIVIESYGTLAKIIQPDKTEVYAQLGKEVLEILNSTPNDADAGSKIRKLYGL